MESLPEVDLNKSCAEYSIDREVGEDILISAVEKKGFQLSLFKARP